MKYAELIFLIIILMFLIFLIEFPCWENYTSYQSDSLFFLITYFTKSPINREKILKTIYIHQKYSRKIEITPWYLLTFSFYKRK